MAAAATGPGTALTAPASAAGLAPAAVQPEVKRESSAAPQVATAGRQAPSDIGTAAEWNPPAHLVRPLNEVWQHVEQTSQLMADGGGHLDYCVRRETDAPVSAQLRPGPDDFYDGTPTGVPNFLMRAGSAGRVTEFDVWLARDVRRHVKDRYNVQVL
ncbi:hypothetical protein ACWGNE_13400 [Streptomyces xiamenensis]